MSCQKNQNRGALAATRRGVTRVASNTAYFAGVAAKQAAGAATLGAAVGGGVAYIYGGDVERSAIGSATMAASASLGSSVGAAIGGRPGHAVGYVLGALLGFKGRDNVYQTYRLGKLAAYNVLGATPYMRQVQGLFREWSR